MFPTLTFVSFFRLAVISSLLSTLMIHRVIYLYDCFKPTDLIFSFRLEFLNVCTSKFYKILIEIKIIIMIVNFDTHYIV